MAIWIIEPRDPLIVRDGRPFSADPGAWATSLPFPFPSTTTGGVRTRAGLDENGVFKCTGKELDELKLLAVRGPLLVLLPMSECDTKPGEWLVPAPCDALLLERAKGKDGELTDLVNQLVPLELPEDAQTDLDLDTKRLWFVGQACYDKRKPYKKAPRYWGWENFQAWLQDPSFLCETIKHVCELGIDGPISEQRVHVSIDAQNETARDGMLFGTSGLEFTSPGKGEKRLRDAKRLALAVAVDDCSQLAPREGIAGFGGERRMVSWRKSDMKLPLCPTDLENTIVEDKACRLFLLTPACFQEGYLPTWLYTNAEQHGVTIDPRSIAVQRPQVVSGWDLALRKPKPSRRLASAGTVLFLKLKGSNDALRDWIEHTWMQCISDDAQDRTDGFGLAVLGSWDGEQVAMKMKEDLCESNQ